MSSNPYSPPQAPVADAPPDVVTKKPWQTVTAVRLLWASLGVAVLSSALDWKHVPAEVSPLVFILISAVLFSLFGWFIATISRGRNWARVTLIVLVVLGAFVQLASLSSLSRQSFSSLATSGVQAVIQWAATALLLMRPSRDWFRQSRPR